MRRDEDTEDRNIDARDDYSSRDLQALGCGLAL